jgi:hypothetical protein
VAARDGAIAVVGGTVLCALGLWFWREAVLIEFDDTPRDYYMSKARWYGSIGLLALVPGLVGISLRNRRPKAGRRLTALGGTVILAALLYLVGSLAMIMLDM